MELNLLIINTYMMNRRKLKLLVASLAILSTTVACSIKRNFGTDVALKSGHARIEFARDNHIPHIFQEKLFGLISSLSTEAGQKIDIDPANKAASVRFVDVLPGTYKLKANCDPVNNHSGDQYNWLVNHELTITAYQVVTLGCEYYKEEKTDRHIRSF